jgi:hypothetical protein
MERDIVVEYNFRYKKNKLKMKIYILLEILTTIHREN